MRIIGALLILAGSFCPMAQGLFPASFFHHLLPSGQSASNYVPHKIIDPTGSIAHEREEFIRTDHASRQQKLSDQLNSDIQSLTQRLERLESTTRAAEKKLLQKELDLKKTAYQVMVDQKFVINDIESIFDQREKTVQEITADPHLTNALIHQKTAYSFEDLQLAYGQAMTAKQAADELKRTAQGIKDGMFRRDKTIRTIIDDLKIKHKEQENFKEQKDFSEHGIQADASARIVDADIILDQERIELEKLKIFAAQQRLALVQTQLHRAKESLSVLDRQYYRVKRGTVIPDEDIKKFKNDHTQKITQTDAPLRELQNNFMLVTMIKREVKARFDDEKSKLGVSPAELASMQDVTYQPKNKTQWHILAQLLPMVFKLDLHDVQSNLVQSQINVLKAERKRELLDIDVIESWRALTSRSFSHRSRTYISDNIHAYESLKNEFYNQVKTISEERDEAINSLKSLNKKLESVKGLSTLAKESQDIILSNDPLYQEVYQALLQAEDTVRQEIDVTTQNIERYQATITILDDAIRHIDAIVSELSSKGFWQRSDQSIDWSNIKMFVPELQRFFSKLSLTISEYFTLERLSSRVASIGDIVTDIYKLMIAFILGIIALIFFIAIRLYLPDLADTLSTRTMSYGFIPYMRKLCALIVTFITMHATGMYVWLLLYIAITAGLITDPFLGIMFHLLSIPYLIYLTIRFMNHLMHENDLQSGALINKDYALRFGYVVTTVLCILTLLYFVRGALLLHEHTIFEAPTILLALMFIVVQIGLISLLGKKQILSMVPRNTPLWQWIFDHLERYYYFFWSALIIIIVMSNPYVGFGRQMLYLVTRVIGTVLVLPISFWIHGKIKSAFSNLFFYYEDGDTLKERFSSGRLWYGLFTILSFMVFAIGLTYLISMIWGSGLTLQDIAEFFSKELATLKDEMGKEVPISLFSLLQIGIFLIAGIFLNYIINQFVIQRVFDPIIVGAGVQNTISALTKYGIIIIAVFIGLTNAGLEGLTTKFAILLAGLGIAAQEPLRDFVSYFIILVQRPVKIGDFIQINPEVRGVVRHITPRSVIMRLRNSVTIIVPNSQIILNPIMNWNYTRSYFAFDDIMVTVPYVSDPDLVKKILLQVLEDNPMVLRTPAPIVWLDDFVDNGYQFLVRGYLTADKVLERWEISSQVRLEMVRRLAVHKILIAGPSRIIRMADPLSPPRENQGFDLTKK